MAGPGKALDIGRAETADGQGLALCPGDAHSRCGALTQQYRHGLVQIAQGCRQAPYGQFGLPRPQPGQAQLQLHAALVTQQFVPFIDDDRIQMAEAVLGVAVGEQYREAFRRRHQGVRQLALLSRAHAGGGIASTRLDPPVQPQGIDGSLQMASGVSGQGTQRRDPEYLQATGALPILQCPGHRAQPGGQGLARAGGGVNQPAMAGAKGLPGLALERRWLPALAGEPGVDGGQPIHCRLGLNRHRG